MSIVLSPEPLNIEQLLPLGDQILEKQSSAAHVCSLWPHQSSPKAQTFITLHRGKAQKAPSRDDHAEALAKQLEGKVTWPGRGLTLPSDLAKVNQR